MSPSKRVDKKSSRPKHDAGATQGDADARAISSVDEIAPDQSEPPTDPQATATAEVSDDAPVDAGAAAVDPPSAQPATSEQRKRVIESLVFVSDRVITAQQIARIVKTKLAEVRELLEELVGEYSGRGIELVEVAGGYQFRSAPASAPFVRDFVAQRPVRLTRAQVETLALVAYRQPITRPEIDDVRGVDSGSALKVLLERGLLKILGRKDEPGRPLLYGSTPHFLEFFGMKSMQDLPTLREFTDLTDEHRELFKRKTGEVPDLSAESLIGNRGDEPQQETFDDDELMAIAEAAKTQRDEDEPAATTASAEEIAPSDPSADTAD